MWIRMIRLILFLVAIPVFLGTASIRSFSAPSCRDTYEPLLAGQTEEIRLAAGEIGCYTISVSSATMLKIRVDSNAGFNLYVGYEIEPTSVQPGTYSGSVEIPYPIPLDGNWRIAIAGEGTYRLTLTPVTTGDFVAHVPDPGTLPLTSTGSISINDRTKPDSVTLGSRAGDKVIFPLVLTEAGTISANVKWTDDLRLVWRLRDPTGAIKNTVDTYHPQCCPRFSRAQYTVTSGALNELGSLWSLELINQGGGRLTWGEVDTLDYPGDVPITLNRVVRSSLGGANNADYFKVYLPSARKLDIELHGLGGANLPLFVRYGQRPLPSRGDIFDWSDTSLRIDKKVSLPGAKSGWYYIQVGYAESSPSKYELRALVAPDETTLTSPSGTIATSRPVYSWKIVDGATWYYLWIDDSTGKEVHRKWFPATEILSLIHI